MESRKAKMEKKKAKKKREQAAYDKMIKSHENYDSSKDPVFDSLNEHIRKYFR